MMHWVSISETKYYRAGQPWTATASKRDALVRKGHWDLSQTNSRGHSKCLSLLHLFIHLNPFISREFKVHSFFLLSTNNIVDTAEEGLKIESAQRVNLHVSFQFLLEGYLLVRSLRGTSKLLVKSPLPWQCFIELFSQ